MLQTPEIVNKVSSRVTYTFYSSLFRFLVIFACTLLLVFALCLAPAMISLLGRLSLIQSVFGKLGDSYWKVLKPVEYGIALGSSAIADVVMLWRCLVVWNNDWRVMAVPVFGLISTHASAFFVPPESPVLAASIALNKSFLTGMIAFRMIKMCKEAVARVGTGPKAIARMVIATILESGSIQSVYTTLMFCVSMAEAHLGRFGKLLGVSIHLWPFVSATVSATIIVRSALGMSFNNVESAISSLGGVKSKSPVDIARTVGRTLSNTGSSIAKDYASFSSGEPSLSPVDIVRTVSRTLSGSADSDGEHLPAADIVRTLSGIVTGKVGLYTTQSEVKPSPPVDTIVRRVSGQVLSATNNTTAKLGIGVEPSSSVELSNAGDNTPRAKDGDTGNTEADSEGDPLAPGHIVRVLYSATEDKEKRSMPKHQDPIFKTTNLLKEPLGKIFPL